MNINVAFNIGQTVYLKTDPDQLARLITGYSVRPQSICYYVSCKTEESTHYEFELRADKDVLMTTTN